MKNRLPEYVDHLIQYTDKQRTSLLRIHGQHIGSSNHPDFKRTNFITWVARDCYNLEYLDCAMAHVPNMAIGIEHDGYSHT